MTQTVSTARTTSLSPRRPTQRATHWVLFGSLASGLGAYAFQVLGVRVLGEVAYAPISILWTLQYLVSTIALYSAEAFVTRTATLHGDAAHTLARPIRVIAVWVGVLAFAFGVGTWVLRDALFAGAGDLAVVTGLIIASYGAFFVIKGRMAGTGRFRSYGAATALESIGRIIVAMPVLVVAGTTRSLAWIMPLGPAMVAAWWLYDRRKVHRPDPLPPDEIAAQTGGTAGRFLAATTVANAVSQTLLAAGPLVLLPLGASAGEVSVFFVTITAARVPLVFAFGGLLSRILPPLTRLARAGKDAQLRRIAFLIAAGSSGLGLVGGAAAWLLGPPLIAAFFGSGSRPGQAFVALSTFGVLLATGSALLNQVLIARHSESRMVAPWIAALVVAVVAVLTSSGSATLRVSIGFAAGEIVALVGLVLAIWTAPRLSGLVDVGDEPEIVPLLEPDGLAAAPSPSHDELIAD